MTALSWTQATSLTPLASDYACPARWKYEHLDRLPQVPQAWLLRGSYWDSLVRAYLAGEAPDPEAVWLDVSAEWPELAATFPDARDMALRVAAPAAEIASAFEGRIALLQPRLEGTLPGLAEDASLIGYPDWVTTEGQICDLKVSASKRWDKEGHPSERWLHGVGLQMAIYALLLDQAGNLRQWPARGLCVSVYDGAVKVPQVAEFEVEITAELAAEATAAVLAAGAIRQQGHYPARPGGHCGWCSYIETCREDLAWGYKR